MFIAVSLACAVRAHDRIPSRHLSPYLLQTVRTKAARLASPFSVSRSTGGYDALRQQSGTGGLKSEESRTSSSSLGTSRRIEQAKRTPEESESTV
jgi:hypothetical protein